MGSPGSWAVALSGAVILAFAGGRAADEPVRKADGTDASASPRSARGFADARADGPLYEAELVFPLHPKHNHAPGIVECPNGDLLVSWYRGSGERDADDVAVYGARKRARSGRWGDAFLLADTPGFPDCNTALFLDGKKRAA
jgi:hypothetical protein